MLPRRTKLSRKVTGRETEEQVLVTNVDIAFVVQALDRSFNLALLQRHLAMVVEGGVKPVVVLNKADLCDDVLAKLAAVEPVAADAPVVAVSAKTGRAIDRLTQLILPRETMVFIGASGVGKSSLINQIYGEEVQATMEVRESDAKGRHMTSWRELIVLPNGGLVIDTPGMREFQMWLAGEGGLEAVCRHRRDRAEVSFPQLQPHGGEALRGAGGGGAGGVAARAIRALPQAEARVEFSRSGGAAAAVDGTEAARKGGAGESSGNGLVTKVPEATQRAIPMYTKTP